MIDLDTIEVIKAEAQEIINSEYRQYFPSYKPPRIDGAMVRIIIDTYERVKPRRSFEKREKEWPLTPIAQLLKGRLTKGIGIIQMAYLRGEITGDLETLRKIASDSIKIRLIGPKIREEIKQLLDTDGRYITEDEQVEE